MKSGRQKELGLKGPKNFLITGPPGSGKSTVIRETLSALKDRDLKAGGIFCPEIREKGKRLGFEIVDIMTGESKILAHVDQSEGPRISKYRVNVPNVDSVIRAAIPQAMEKAAVIVIDEIAPMEAHSDVFKHYAAEALNSPKPVLAAIHRRSTSGFIGKVKERPDSRIIEVTKENRNSLPGKLEKLILGALE